MRRLFLQLLTAIFLSALLQACGATRTRSDVRQYLEDATGTSITSVKTPAAFVREQPGLASSGRDYVFLAPIIVNLGGQRSCWLWLGLWSTIDRQARNERASPLTLGALQIVADNEPMDIDLQSTELNSAGIRRIPYSTPVPPTQELLVRVTHSQLQRLGRARVLTLVDRPAEGAARLWRGDERAAAVLSGFTEEAGAPGMDSISGNGR
jgi:hypothetical protein